MLAYGLAERGGASLIVCPPRAPMLRILEDAPRGVETLELPMRGEFSVRAWREVGRRIPAERWDLVHTHTPHAITLGHGARVFGPRVPLVAHRRVGFPLKQNVAARWKRGFPDAWIAVSRGVRDRLVADGVAAERIHVVASALDAGRLAARRSREDVRAELRVPESAALVGCVGELAPHKGHAVLIEALGRLGDAAVCAVLVGRGEERAALEEAARARGVAERVRFAGQRDDVGDLLRAMDLFVMPSVAGEGSPAALKEALALAVPVLASDLAVHAELGLETADLFASGDAASLASALSAKLADAGRARERARQLAPLAAPFTPERMVCETLSIYARLLSMRSR
jgi:glycosyltransferase involved in cell wall biosynthesis